MIFTEKQTEKQVEDFVEAVVHDLKTPTLAQIRAIDLLLDNKFGKLNDTQQDILLQVKNSCNYMNELIHSILNTCQNAEQKIILNCEQFDIKNLADKVINEIKNLAEIKNQKIILKTQAKENLCFADELQIKRVITNLIFNAINHGLKGNDIYIFLENSNGRIRFFVKNKAKYITEDKIKELFQKYKVFNSNNAKSCNGLGLYLSKQIIEEHNGKFFALSYPNKTCIFGFELKQ